MKKALFLFFAALSSFFFLSIEGAEPEHKKPILVFDFGGVIAEADNEVVFTYLERSLSLSRNGVMHVIAQLRESRIKGVSEEQFWNEYATSTNMTLPEKWIESLNAVQQSAIRPNSRMIEMVKRLKAMGYRIALLSNVQKHQAKIVRDTGLYLYFDPIVLSCEIGVEKPNIDAYQILLQRLHAVPKECIMIDDSPENIQSAQRLGMGTILFQSTDSFFAELKWRNIPEEPRNELNFGFSVR